MLNLLVVLHSRGTDMWSTEKGAKTLQVVLLLGLGLIASRDVDRTMRQTPMTPEQQQVLVDFASKKRDSS